MSSSTQAVKDHHLMILISGVVIIDILLIGALSFYDGGKSEAKLIMKKESPSSITTGVRDCYQHYDYDYNK